MSNRGRESWKVEVGDDGVHFVIIEPSGRVHTHVMGADCAENIAGSLRQAAKQYVTRIIMERGAVGGPM